MAFSYKPLWKKLIDYDLSKKVFMEHTGISKSTIDKMGRGENISLDILDRICSFFDCPIQEVIAYIHVDENNYEGNEKWTTLDQNTHY